MNQLFLILIWLLIVLMPSSSKLGGVSAWYMLTFVLCLLGLFFKVVQKKIRYPIEMFSASLPFLLLLSLMAVSLFFSMDYAVPGDILELLRMIVNLSVMVCVYNYSNRKSKLLLYRFYVWFIPFEIVVSVLQKHSGLKSIFSIIWNMDKAWFLRSTGTLANPNVLAIYLIVGYVFVFFSEFSTKKVKLLYYLLVLVGVGLTGSRTGLLVFILMSALIYLASVKINLLMFVKFFVVSLFGLVSLVVLLRVYSSELGYMAQILDVYQNGTIDVSRVKTFTSRLDMWSRNFSVLEGADPFRYLIGMGPGKDIGLRVMDSEYLSQFLRYGFLGVILNFLMLLVLFYQVFKARYLIGSNVVKFLGVTLVLMAFYGLVSASFSSVLNFLPIVFFVGVFLKDAQILKEVG